MDGDEVCPVCGTGELKTQVTFENPHSAVKGHLQKVTGEKVCDNPDCPSVESDMAPPAEGQF